MEKPKKAVKVNLGQQALRQEQKLRGDNLESLKRQAGWEDIIRMISERFRDEVTEALSRKEDKDILKAVTNAKAILDFAKSIGAAINSGNVADKLLQDSVEKNKPCR